MGLTESIDMRRQGVGRHRGTHAAPPAEAVWPSLSPPCAFVSSSARREHGSSQRSLKGGANEALLELDSACTQWVPSETWWLRALAARASGCPE